MNPNRKPKMHLSDEQKAIIDKVWKETRLGARLLIYELKRRGYKIPHNKIHQYLRETGRITPNPKKQKKRKRCRALPEKRGNKAYSIKKREYTDKWQVRALVAGI